MAHYAKVESNMVTKVLVADAEFFKTFVDDAPGKWIQTSYNTFGGIHYDPITGEADGGTALRMNYAGEGYIYDSTEDAFYQPQPYNSWTLNKNNYLWEAPVACPTDGKMYDWNEDTLAWDEVVEPT
jgi:hypothetical protein